MTKQQAQQIIRDTFESSFDKNKFTGFIKNLLNRIEDAPFTYKGNYIPDAYKQYIKTLERIGKFSDGENNIDILVITLQKKTSLERARTMQRNFVAWYLNGSRGGVLKDAALAAFVSPDKTDWRFSLVKMDYKFEKTKSDKVKVKEEFTPARRWSFLVGANEKSHTAQSSLVKILANDEQAPTLQEIEKAFDIETVTKEFFLKYRELFLRIKEELDRVVKNDTKVEADFNSKGVDTVNFAKKLLGQIIFLYFLQKKGWFGVERDADWGEGSKHFMRELFESKHGPYKNFFNDILEPLFYDALSRDRSDIDHWNDQFKCKIPFLNGGLFDPIGNYSWYSTDILLPDKLFSNTNKTKEGDTGDGILDIFDRYNFTVKEDEPLEKEVAIDPELLGKAYEKFNAIRPDNYDEFKKALKSGKKGEENKFNKKFGVYYTPREIVHYMCQQSLINYLSTELDGKASKEDIETLIHIGEHISENEVVALIKEQSIKDGKQKTSEYKLKLTESIRKNAALIDDKLAYITVCDPAVGSGAFPVGMMHEIVRVRNVLSVFLNENSRRAYEFKRRCIEHSLYGVDIDPGAVEIAKLRLWLSLVVDEDDIKNIKPLPNLDYRIMQGNSLISEFMGINFDTDNETKSDNLPFEDETDELIEQFEKKKSEFLNESNVSRKLKIKEEVDDQLVKIFETKLRTQKAEYFIQLTDIENKYSILPNEKQKDEFIKQDKGKLYKESGFDLESVEKQLREFTSGRQIRPFFLWNLYFSEVFHNKGGFDVVIANPPWVSLLGKHGPVDGKDSQKLYLKIYDANTYMPNLYELFIKRGLTLLSDSGHLIFIIPDRFGFNQSFAKLRRLLLIQNTVLEVVYKWDFESVIVDTMTLLIRRGITPVDTILIKNRPEEEFLHIKREQILASQGCELRGFASFAVKELVEKIRNNSIPLGKIAKTTSGFGGKSSEITTTRIKPKQIPVLKGASIQRYVITKQYFFEFKDANLSGRTRDVQKLGQKEKVLLRKTGDRIIAAFDDSGIYPEQSLYFLYDISPEAGAKYLIGLLNSKLITWYYLNYLVTNLDSTPQLKNYDLDVLPINLSKSDAMIVCLVDRILAAKRANSQVDTSVLAQEIDQLVFKLYDLTPEEIRIVEGENPNDRKT